MPIIAHFVAYKPGHHLNIMLARELIARKECWEVLDHLVGEGELSERQPLNVPTFRTLDACPA